MTSWQNDTAIMTFSVNPLGKKGFYVTLSMWHSAQTTLSITVFCNYAECHVSMLIVLMLNAILLSDVMLNVVEPFIDCYYNKVIWSNLGNETLSNQFFVSSVHSSVQVSLLPKCFIQLTPVATCFIFIVPIRLCVILAVGISENYTNWISLGELSVKFSEWNSTLWKMKTIVWIPTFPLYLYVQFMSKSVN